MQREEIFSKIINIIRKATSNPNLELDESTLFEDIEDWDSLTTVDVEMEIESVFGLSFQVGEFKELKSIKNLLDLIAAKLA